MKKTARVDDGMAQDILSELNDEQRKAVTMTEGYVRVVAGAGSGKTRALSHRFAYLVNNIGVLPSDILCVTFTNKSANEMRRRIRRLTGDNDTGYINTFHGFCVSVLQEDISAVGYPKSFLVLDNSDIDAMLKIVYEERGLTLRNMTFSSARDMIEIMKLFKHPDYCEELIALPLEGLHEKYLAATSTDEIIFRGYLYWQKKCFGLDYNDLIKYSLYIFAHNDDIRLKWQQRLEYIMIDEFQDIDWLQYELMGVLCGWHKNLFVVGDPDQTVYTWRGANMKYLLNFEQEYPGTRTVMMMSNYRSTPQILAVANSLIDKNRERMKKELLPTLPDGPRVVYSHAKTVEEEAQWIANTVFSLIENGAHAGDMTVLYRAHYVSRVLEEVFLRRELPYTLYSGVPFFARAEIKDALSYLRLVAYKDDLSFARVVNNPKRNLGERRMRFLRQYADENGCTLYTALTRTLDDEIFKNTKAKRFVDLIERFSANCRDTEASELLSGLLDQSGYEAQLRTEGSQTRLDNLAELKQSVHDFEVSCGEESTLESYLAHVAMLTNADAGSQKDAVKLMTVHTAKGLEFPYVFVCSLNEGIFPSKKVDSLEGMEEERRLAFVAFTRAQKGLFLSEAEGRNLDGSVRFPSRFILDVDRELLDYTVELDESFVSEADLHIKNNVKWLQSLSGGLPFSIGERVVHDVMGAGVIEDIDRERHAYIVRFDELNTSRALSFKAVLHPEQLQN